MPRSNTPFAQSHAARTRTTSGSTSRGTHLYALDVRTGALVWRKPCMERTFAFSPAIGGPAVADGRVFCPRERQRPLLLRRTHRRAALDGPLPGDKYGHSSPKVRDGKLYVGCLGDKGEVRCVSVGGQRVFGPARPAPSSTDSSPALGDDFLAIGSADSLLNVLLPRRRTHRRPAPHAPRPLPLHPRRRRRRGVYAATYSDEVVALALGVRCWALGQRVFQVFRC